MIGMIQILTYMLAFYLVMKGIEILQIGLASNRESKGVIVGLGVLSLCACVIAAVGFVALQEHHVQSMNGMGAGLLSGSVFQSEGLPGLSEESPAYRPRSTGDNAAWNRLTEAHNEGWKWAETRKIASKRDCARLEDPDVRYGCEAYVDTYN